MTKEHIHKYMRNILGSRNRVAYKHGRRILLKKSDGLFEVYRCMLPGCTHFVSTDLVVGRRSLCWSCGEEMIIMNANQKRPIHEQCSKRRRIA
jgi:hypothetical protein